LSETSVQVTEMNIKQLMILYIIIYKAAYIIAAADIYNKGVADNCHWQC